MKTIEELAREAGFNVEDSWIFTSARDDLDCCRQQLERFAALVRAQALEEAAKVCCSESVVLATRDQTRGALHCAATIRALKDKTCAGSSGT